MNPTAPLRVIIVEDLIAIQQDIEYLLQQYPAFIVVGTCGTVHDAIVLIHSSKPDLLLLDIGLPDGTGFDILEQLPAPTKVIFLTAHQEYARRAIRYGAIDYLLKPIDEGEFAEALQRAISAQPLLQDQIDITVHNYRKKGQDCIALAHQGVIQIVRLKEIIYLQGDNGNTIFFLKDGKKIVSTENVKDYEELFSGIFFLRPHQSYLVNEIFIDRYHPKKCLIYLKDGTEIPVSVRRKEMIDKYFKSL